VALAGGDQGPDGIGVEGFGDGDEQGLFRAGSVAAGPIKACLHVPQAAVLRHSLDQKAMLVPK
jgi:hypothetical protein